jgi:hypothetical protein
VFQAKSQPYDAISAYREAVKSSDSPYQLLQAQLRIAYIVRFQLKSQSADRDIRKLEQLYLTAQRSKWLQRQGRESYNLSAQVAEFLGDVSASDSQPRYYQESLQLFNFIQNHSAVSRVLAKFSTVSRDTDHRLITDSLNTLSPYGPSQHHDLYRPKYEYQRQMRQIGPLRSTGDYVSAEQVLRQARADIKQERKLAGARYEPDNLDLILMSLLYDTLLHTNPGDDLSEVANEIKYLQATRGAAIYYRIGQNAQQKDPTSALDYYELGTIIGAKAPDNYYYQQCRVLRDQLKQQKGQPTAMT